MDRARNPYTPNAGAPPRYLAGRRAEVDDFRVLLKRLGAGYTEQSLVVTGLRGVGKTVLLGEYQKIAAELGRGDSGSLNEDLADVFEAIGNAASERGSGVVFLFDEIQFLSKAELEALIGAVHRTVQRQLPITFAGAGLPQLPGLAGDAKSYAERLFKFPMIGELPDRAATQALVEPARLEGVTFDKQAIDMILKYTEGYPYFIQEFGRTVWNLADGSTITEADAELAQTIVEAELDESFFRARIQRSTMEERRYMRAMAELGPNAHKAADVAEVLGKGSDQVAPLRARLINKGLLYTPRYGFAQFTVPQFDQFMRRYMELDTDALPEG